MSSSQARVFSAYRKLFRARKYLFEGDQLAMSKSRVEIKQQFAQNRVKPNVGPEFEGLLGMVDEAVDMMRHQIMRGNLNKQTGNYAVKVKPDHTQGLDHANVEPITPNLASKMAKDLETPKVEISNSQNANNNNSTGK